MNGDFRWILSLGNSICGVAILTLPHCFTRCGVVLGSLLLLGSALLTLWSCQLLLKTAFSIGKFSYQSIAQELFGSLGRLLVEIGILGLLVGTCAAFFVIVSDLAPVLVIHLTGVNLPLDQLRILVPVILAVFVVFPLCLLRNLENLMAISVLSVMFYISLTAQLVVMAMRVLLERDATHVDVWHIEGVFTSLPIFSLSFSCQLILCVMLDEIHEPTFKRMNFIVSGAVLFVSILYCSTALFGHIAFSYVGVEGDILVNFGKSLLAELTRLGFTFSVLVSFPFYVNPLRRSINSFLFSLRSPGVDSPGLPQHRLLFITVTIIIITLIIALVTPNVEVVVGLTGAIAGSVISFIFPALAFLYAPITSGSSTWNKFKAKVILVLGVAMLVIGTMAVMNTGPAEHAGQGEVKSDKEVLVGPLKEIGGIHQPPVEHPGREDQVGDLILGNGQNTFISNKNRTGLYSGKPVKPITAPGVIEVDSQQQHSIPSMDKLIPKPEDNHQLQGNNKRQRAPLSTIEKQPVMPAVNSRKDAIPALNNQQGPLPNDKEQALLPGDNQQALLPGGGKQALLPGEMVQAPLPKQTPLQKQTLLPNGKEQAAIPGINNQQAPMPGGEKQTPLPGGEKQATSVNQQAPASDAQKQQVVLPHLGNQQAPLPGVDKQASLPASDSQQAPLPGAGKPAALHASNNQKVGMHLPGKLGLRSAEEQKHGSESQRAPPLPLVNKQQAALSTKDVLLPIPAAGKQETLSLSAAKKQAPLPNR